MPPSREHRVDAILGQQRVNVPVPRIVRGPLGPADGPQRTVDEHEDPLAAERSHQIPRQPFQLVAADLGGLARQVRAQRDEVGGFVIPREIQPSIPPLPFGGAGAVPNVVIARNEDVGHGQPLERLGAGVPLLGEQFGLVGPPGDHVAGDDGKVGALAVAAGDVLAEPLARRNGAACLARRTTTAHHHETELARSVGLELIGLDGVLHPIATAPDTHPRQRHAYQLLHGYAPFLPSHSIAPRQGSPRRNIALSIV